MTIFYLKISFLLIFFLDSDLIISINNTELNKIFDVF